MKGYTRFGVMVGCLIGGDVTLAVEKTPSQVFRSVSQSIVVVEAPGTDRKTIAQGSGVVIAPGIVVSNCHVFTKAQNAVVRYRQNRYPAELRHVDIERDLCSFTVTGLHAPSAMLGKTSRLQVGDRVYAIGAPQGLELSLSDGLIANLRRSGGAPMLQITTPISPGSSGGGLFNDQGELIGITTLYLKESQQLNFAVPVEWISELPARSAVRDAGAAASAAQAEAGAQEAIEKAAAAASAQAEADAREAIADAMATSAAQAGADAAAAAEAAAGSDNATGTIYTYVKAGSRHYTTLPPYKIPGATDIRVSSSYSFKAAAPDDASSRWKTIARYEDRRVDLDTRTLKRTGDQVIAWIRSTYSPPTKIGDIEGIADTTDRWIVNCSEQAIKTSSLTAYSKSGAVLHSATYPYATWKQAIPDSMGETILQSVCNE